MAIGCLMLDENRGEYVIFLGYNLANEIMVMYSNGFIYHGCELRFKEI